MRGHVLLPGVDLAAPIRAEYRDYLRTWREEAITLADAGDVAMSTCLQASFVDLALHGKVVHDWLGVMDEFLTVDSAPVAYSAAYGRRLHRFDAQYLQSTVHAIHSRWWIEGLNGRTLDHDAFADRILAKKQADGLIYDRDISETILRHRMKSELTLSATQAIEILSAAGRITSAVAVTIATPLADPKTCPPLGYVTMESFRLQALTLLGHAKLFPVGLDAWVPKWETGLEYGWSDFSIADKVDAYMGTAKRTQRDKPVHSPLVACHVAALRPVLADTTRLHIETRMADYRTHLLAQPNDIPAFQMRDVTIPFGADRTPIEAICASHLMGS